jgi:hypothetical protein
VRRRVPRVEARLDAPLRAAEHARQAPPGLLHGLGLEVLERVDEAQRLLGRLEASAPDPDLPERRVVDVDAQPGVLRQRVAERALARVDLDVARAGERRREQAAERRDLGLAAAAGGPERGPLPPEAEAALRRRLRAVPPGRLGGREAPAQRLVALRGEELRESRVRRADGFYFPPAQAAALGGEEEVLVAGEERRGELLRVGDVGAQRRREERERQEQTGHGARVVARFGAPLCS